MKKLLTATTIFAAILFTGCGDESDSQETNRGESIPSVEAVQARFGGLPLVERVSGVVRAEKQVEIYSRISAPVEEVYRKDGDAVSGGDPLIRLRDREFRERVRQAEADLRINQARRKQAEAQLKEAQSQLNRQRVLAERKLSSDIEIERLEAQLQSAEANYELASAQVEQAASIVDEQKELLKQTVIRSPITGTVGQRNIEAGMQIDTGTRLFTVGNLNDAIITVNLTEQMLGFIREGQRVTVASESLDDRTLEAEISRISPFLEAGNFSTEAEIDVKNTRDLLIPGMFVTVDVMYGESDQATLIPLSAIYRHPRTGETGVYVAPDFGTETEPVEQVDSSNPPPLSEPTSIEFVTVDVIAKGRETAGVVGVQSGAWIVTVGQNLLINNRSETARIRATSWGRIMRMQEMKPGDLLREIMNERMAERSGSQSSTQS
ncbi:MAG: efflux RND transporter periplasmic adaptor subunit [Bacteroidetes bacterium]|jgi:RND family efflux transporter MFP subunit|nr:efflux RND transporter periplasmic adaptor subunit [Bacteroidota bacterium]